jgi:hypothetical protein
MFDDRLERRTLFRCIRDESNDAKHDRAAVIHRVVEHRPGVDNPVQMGDRHADRGAVNSLQIASPGGAVQIDDVIDASVSSWQHNRCTIAHQSEMADQARVQHFI